MNKTEKWNDQAIEAEIKRLCNAVETWARSHDLWFDCGFKSHIEHVDGEPNELPIITILWCEGSLRDVICGEDGAGE